jgi:hypothetical protein
MSEREGYMPGGITGKGWKPGQSGNPGGRPKGQSITARLRAVLEQEHNGKALMDLLAERIAKEALAGKFHFVKEVLDRLDGRAKERPADERDRPPHRTIVVLEKGPDGFKEVDL